MALHRIVQALRADNHAEAVAIFSEIGNDPVDIALVEHCRTVAVVKAQFDWDDLGSWDSINRSLPSDDADNVGVGRIRAVESNGNVIYNEVEGLRVNLLGVEDMVMVVTEDEILLCPRDRSQDVRRLT
jgi:mannose-1-phosphate guanylyltransferase